MGKIIFLLLAFVFSLKILTTKDDKKILWFLAGILFFPDGIILFNSPVIMTFPRLLTYMLVISMLIENKRCAFAFNDFPVRKSFVFVLIMLLCIGLLDPRLTLFLKIYRPVTYFVENFFILFATYYFIKNAKDVLLIYKTILIFFLVFCLYGLINYITKDNLYNSLITNLYGTPNFANINGNDLTDRFRINSFAWHAIYYGFLLSIPIYICIFYIYYTILNKVELVCVIILTALLIINLLLTNSRTPLLSLAAGLCILISFGLDFKNKVSIFIITTLAVVLGILLIPTLSKVLTETIYTFTSKGSSLDGSSMEMRAGQMESSIAIFKRNPITGNGFQYINEGLGFSTQNIEGDEELMGFESYSFMLLIEQGLCGIIGNIILFSSIFLFFIKSLKSPNYYSVKLSILSISMLITFLIFIMGTGGMGTFPFFMAIMGINIKVVHLFKMRSQQPNEYD